MFDADLQRSGRAAKSIFITPTNQGKRRVRCRFGRHTLVPEFHQVPKFVNKLLLLPGGHALPRCFSFERRACHRIAMPPHWLGCREQRSVCRAGWQYRHGVHAHDHGNKHRNPVAPNRTCKPSKRFLHFPILNPPCLCGRHSACINTTLRLLVLKCEVLPLAEIAMAVSGQSQLPKHGYLMPTGRAVSTQRCARAFCGV